MCHRQTGFACDSPVPPVTVFVQSGTVSGSGDGGVCFGGETDAHVPAISATFGSPLLVIDSGTTARSFLPKSAALPGM